MGWIGGREQRYLSTLTVGRCVRVAGRVAVGESGGHNSNVTPVTATSLPQWPHHTNHPTTCYINTTPTIAIPHPQHHSHVMPTTETPRPQQQRRSVTATSRPQHQRQHRNIHTNAHYSNTTSAAATPATAMPRRRHPRGQRRFRQPCYYRCGRSKAGKCPCEWCFVYFRIGG